VGKNEPPGRRAGTLSKLFASPYYASDLQEYRQLAAVSKRRPIRVNVAVEDLTHFANNSLTRKMPLTCVYTIY